MGKRLLDQAIDAVEQSYVTFPYILLTKYQSIGLTDQEAMVVLQAAAYQQIEHSFPSLDELVSRMSISKDQIAAILQSLLGQGLLVHANHRLSLRPLFERMIGVHANENAALSVFTRFEEEFGRLLSPLEYEQVIHWIDEDGYTEWLIVEALRESVLAGVYNFRYVDTILREWERSNIKTEQQLTDHRKRHRGVQRSDRQAAASKSSSGGRQGAPRPDKQTPEERIVPAVQPGKYERFYQVYKGTATHPAAQETQDLNSRPPG
ncbi:MAG: DnaD domain-containing protein [Bacilli bacterium]